MAPPVGPSATPPPPPAVPAGGSAPTTGRGPMVWAAGGAGVVLASAVLTLLAYRTVAPDRSSEALARVPQAPVEQVPVGQEPVVNPTVKAVEEPVEVPPVETAVVSRSLPPAVAEASCRTDGQSDATGRTITYEPAQTIDGDLSTAWRCAGSAVGQELTLRLAGLTTVTSVGLVPGYAKVDPADGIDRFALYRTVTGVEWRFDDGTVVAQDVSAPRASMTTLELAEPVTTSSVTMVVTSTGNDAAEYDFTAVSEVELSGF